MSGKGINRFSCGIDTVFQNSEHFIGFCQTSLAGWVGLKAFQVGRIEGPPERS